MHEDGCRYVPSIPHSSAVSPILWPAVHVPLVLICASGEQVDRKWMEIKSLMDVVDEVASKLVVVVAVEDIKRGV